VGVWHGADGSETITGVRMWRSESNGSKFSVAMRLSASRTVATATTSEFVTYPNGTVVRFVPEQVSHGLLGSDPVPQCNSQLETRLARPDLTPDTEPTV
jgi:hypothetical protein